MPFNAHLRLFGFIVSDLRKKGFIHIYEPSRRQTFFGHASNIKNLHSFEQYDDLRYLPVSFLKGDHATGLNPKALSIKLLQKTHNPGHILVGTAEPTHHNAWQVRPITRRLGAPAMPIASQ